MRQNLRQIILSIGLLLVFISFLFYGRHAWVYLVLLTCGLLISFVSYLTLLFGNKSGGTKIIWAAFVLFAAGLCFVAEPILIRSSYLIYVSSNADELKAISDILIKHDGEVSIDRDTVIAKSSKLSVDEKEQLMRLREKVDAYLIWKTNSDIYYGLYGFVNVRLGVAYVISGDKPKTQSARTHLTGKWFY